VRLQVYAESGGLYDIKNQKPGFIIECFPLEPSSIELNNNGVIVGIATGLQKSTDALSNLKTCSGLIYAMAARQAASEKWNDALICNSNNIIIESTIANIFWIKDKGVYTPPLSDGCIAGVMRRHVITQLAGKGIHIQERSLDLHAALHADEMFLTNAVKRIKWVRSLNEVTALKNSVTKEVYHIITSY